MAVLFSRATTGLSARTGIALYTRTPAQVTGFSVHFDGGETPKTEKRSLELLRGYDSYHAGKGWGGIGYNLAVCPVTGKVYEARGLDRVGAHTVGHNTSSVGVIVIGGEGNLTAAAKRGLQDAYDIAAKWAGKDLEVFGHKDKNSTSCPGDAIYKWIKNGGIINMADKKPTTYVDGRLVAAGTAAAFAKLAAAFKQATGYTLHVRDGLRTYAQQKDLYDRWKAGTFSAPSVAYPGTSRHETGRALDIYDSGNSPGVTTAGNTRSNWIRNNAARYGFNPIGYTFNEPWHIEYQGDPWAGVGSTPTATKKEETIVKKHYHRQDKTARNGGRTLDPGKHFYLHIETGKANSQASNVIGGIGPYSLTSHLYATGTPGDTVDLVYVFGVDGKNSNHYVERAEIGTDGTVRRNAEFKRAAAAGTSVYLRAVAGEKNKAPVKITVLDSDAYLFATA